MLLRDLQSMLAAVYGVEIGVDVRDYLVTDTDALAAWDRAAQARETAERLLIEEGEAEIGLALYLDPQLLERLEHFDPRHRLCGSNLSDFCLALEGVSHFNYVAWNAAMDRRVTLLELEMQAEVDKYVCARMLLSRQAPGALGGRLVGSLFDEPGFDPELGATESERYRVAARFAAGYCLSLESRYPALAPGVAMLRELRSFYRWSQPAKISHIRSAVLT